MVRPGQVVEWPFAGGDAAQYAEALARAKAAAAEGEVVLGADTIVVRDGSVLGKPRDPEEARAMLLSLGGRGHDVVTAVAVLDRGSERWGHERARVWFRALTRAEVAAYVAGGEPLDKAGAYAYQGGAAAFVERLEGDPDTVIGLPLELVRRLLPERVGGRVRDRATDGE